MARQESPDSRQFECSVWAYRQRLFPAPRNLLAFSPALKKARVAFRGTDTLTLSVRGLRTREMAASEVEGLCHELFTAKQQLIGKACNVLLLGVVTAVVVGVAGLIQQAGTGAVSLSGLMNLLALGLGLGIATGLLLSIPSLPGLLRIRTFDVFTLQPRDGRPWHLAVPQQQAEQVAETLKSLGIESWSR